MKDKNNRRMGTGKESEKIFSVNNRSNKSGSNPNKGIPKNTIFGVPCPMANQEFGKPDEAKNFWIRSPGGFSGPGASYIGILGSAIDRVPEDKDE